MAIGATFGRMVGIMVKAMYRYEDLTFPARYSTETYISAYQTSGMFAVCQPDVPCITPGTYALLGAAAALGWARFPNLIIDFGTDGFFLFAEE